MSGTNKSSAKSPKDSALVLYRLDQVEGKVDAINTKLDAQQNITKPDLKEFSDAIALRFTEFREDFQQQLNKKADAQELKDFKKQMAGWGVLALAILGATYSYFLTRLR